MQEEQKETAAGSPVASFQTRRDKPIEVMSLQEKFIELRRQIPRIEKGQHSRSEMPQATNRANKAIKPLRAARMEPRKSSQRPSSTECTGKLRTPGSPKSRQTAGSIIYTARNQPT